MGVVYRAQDTLLERVVALKVISTTIHDNPELRERFFREARAAGQLSHRNIITIHDLGEHEGQPYLAMECLTGEDLQSRLSRAQAMSFARKLEVAAQICDGLAYAHRHGVIHRDIKPANIFITDEGIVKLLDFGLARMVASEVTASNILLGTLNYMAPEQVRGERTDHRADIFSFGVVLYEVLSGKKAFQGDSYATTLFKILQDAPEPLLSIDPTLPYEAVRIVEKALAKPLDERYQDLTDVGRDLAVLRQNPSRPDTPAVHPPTGPYHVPAEPPRPADPASHASAPRSGTAGHPPDTSPSQPSSARLWRGRRAGVLAAIAGLALAGSAAAWFKLRETSAPDTTATRTSVPSPSGAENAPPKAAEPSAPVAVLPAPGHPPAVDRTLAEEARNEMTRAKSAARSAGTRARQLPAYSAALVAEQEGVRLLRDGKVSEAAAKFYVASGLFHSAELTAATPIGPAPSRAEPQAPAAPSSPAHPVVTPSTPAQSAPPQSPPETSAPAPEPPAQQPAPEPPPLAPATPPERAAPSPPVEATAIAEEGIGDLLAQYEQALESRSIAALKRVWPALGGGQEDAVRKEFAYARRIDVTIENVRVTLSGSDPNVTFVRRYQLVTVDGQRLLTSSRTTMSVRRAGGVWVIDRLRFETLR